MRRDITDEEHEILTPEHVARIRTLLDAPDLKAENIPKALEVLRRLREKPDGTDRNDDE